MATNMVGGKNSQRASGYLKCVDYENVLRGTFGKKVAFFQEQNFCSPECEETIRNYRDGGYVFVVFSPSFHRDAANQAVLAKSRQLRISRGKMFLFGSHDMEYGKILPDYVAFAKQVGTEVSYDLPQIELREWCNPIPIRNFFMEGPAMRYNRVLDPQALQALSGPFRFLIDDVKGLLVSDPYALDIQLRENNKIMYYHGTTRLLVVELRKDSPSPFQVKCSAANAYGNYQDCAKQWKALMRLWNEDEIHDFREAFLSYMAAALKAANRRYYRNRKEGFWQNVLCSFYGKDWTPEKKWLIVDREAVIGFENEEEKSNFYRPHNEKYLKIKKALCQAEPECFGQEDGRDFGDELDLLAIGPEQQLLAIELKHGSSASGVYWGPLQVGHYRDAFKDALPYISDEIKALVRQKVSLGLLAAKAIDRIPHGIFNGCSAVLAVAEPNERSSCWKSMDRVIATVREGNPNYKLRLAKVRSVEVPDVVVEKV